ncbi:CHAT domain-containing protein [Streptomyces avermitilis]
MPAQPVDPVDPLDPVDSPDSVVSPDSADAPDSTDPADPADSSDHLDLLDPLDLLAEREEVLEELSGLPADDPEVPRLCAYAGELSIRLHMLRQEPEDLELAAEAFGHAFARPGTDAEWHSWRIMYGHVRACQFDAESSPELLDECLALVAEGLAGLPTGDETHETDELGEANEADESVETHKLGEANESGGVNETHKPGGAHEPGVTGGAHEPGVADETYEAVRGLGLRLLAAGTKVRCLDCPEDAPAEERTRLFDEALRRHEEAYEHLAPGDPDDAADLNEALGYLRFERGVLLGSAEDGAASAAHYRAALDAARPASDLPFVRHSLGLALLLHGLVTSDRDVLEEARDAFGTALLDAGRAGGDRPEWAWEAEIRSAYIRAVLWAKWQDQGHGAAAEVELAALLAEPDALDRLSPVYLDIFGRLLYERAAHRDDPQGRDRGIMLLRRAVAEWRPEHDGNVTAAALLLATFQQIRHQDDPDPSRLQDIVRGASLAMADEELDPESVQLARMMLAWARHGLEEMGLHAETEGLPEQPGFEELRDMFTAMFVTEEDRNLVDLGERSDFPGIYRDMGGDRRRMAILDEGFARLDALSPDNEFRPRLAAMLLSQLVVLDPNNTDVGADRKQRLLDIVLEHGRVDPDWDRHAQAVVGAARLRDEMAGSGARMDEVLAHFDRAAATGAGDTAIPEVAFARLLARTHRGQTVGAADDLEAAAEAWRQLRDMPHISDYMRRMMDAQLAGMDAQNAAQRGDLAAVDRHIATVLEAHASLDPEDTSRIQLWTSLENALMNRDELARSLGAPLAPPPPGRPTVDTLRREAARLPRSHRAWVLGDNGISRFGRAMRNRDADALADAVTLLREAHDLAEEDSDSRLRYGHCLASAHCVLSEMLPTPHLRRSHLAKGIALFEKAFEQVKGPEHRLYAPVGLSLGRAYRTRDDLGRGDRAEGRRIGLEALRGHAWAALLQSGTAHAAQAAAQATSTALEVAGWCLRDNVPEEAVQALDACRGLVLHAATTSTTVPERLVAAGHTDLAEQWRAAGAGDPLSAAGGGPTLPSELRRRVLAALTAGDVSQERLLDPPTPREIADALRALRKDALVYLVPASEDGGGTAVVVTNGGDVHAVPLPNLTEVAAPLKEYAPAGTYARDAGPRPGGDAAAPDGREGGRDGGREGERDGGPERDLGPVPGFATGEYGSQGARVDTPTLRKQLERLCGWAWYAAMRPLFAEFPEPRAGRVPRLVLVPMGALGLVPWHAAWEQGDDGRRRYALQAAEISYAASARLLCEVAARPAVAHSGAALVVGNPTGDLHYAGEEADAVQRAFYPRGQFLGRRGSGPADGAGSPQEVLSWLRKGGEDEGGVLHLACHAVVAENAPRSAYLALHQGELSAEELTEAVSDGSRGHLGLVLLAACRSHVSGRGHNEAYTLATAFLVSGARSVIGSLWPVPDDATSVLMYLTHHYLRTGGEPPAKALRRAQLWMLDPDRDRSAELPAELADRVRHIDPDDLSAWAGFTHLGQ